MDLNRLLDDKQLVTAKQAQVLDDLKVKHNDVAAFLVGNVADCKELQHAAGKLEEARYWIIQAVSRYPEHYPDA